MRSGATITPPTGWGLVRVDASGSTIRQASYVHVAQASEPSSDTWAFVGKQSGAGIVAAYSGVNTSSPIDGSSGKVNGSSTSIASNGFTTTVDNTALVGFYGTAVNATVTPPSGLVERGEITASGKDKLTLEAADAPLPDSGNTGTPAASASATGVNIAQLVALRSSGGPPPPTDTEAPSTPIGLVATPTSSSQIDLTWTPATDNIAVDHYVVRRDGVALGTHPTLAHFTDTGLAANTLYEYTVQAYDAAGNSSAESDPAQTTTPATQAGGVAFRGASSAGIRSGTTLSLARPSAVQAGDVLVASIDVLGSASLTAPAGWTTLRSDTTSGSELTKRTYWHVVGAVDPATYVWTLSAAQPAAGVLVAYSGVDTGDPFADHDASSDRPRLQTHRPWSRAPRGRCSSRSLGSLPMARSRNRAGCPNGRKRTEAPVSRGP